eukprot:GFKZ01006657.1.p6 GENE.GFKZ01006657.1~~GFKZ01006657.1.p6  ORF type:complete len:136 (-),score=13.41 GFKZ01006657.1:831-1238(-)
MAILPMETFVTKIGVVVAKVFHRCVELRAKEQGSVIEGRNPQVTTQHHRPDVVVNMGDHRRMGGERALPVLPDRHNGGSLGEFHISRALQGSGNAAIRHLRRQTRPFVIFVVNRGHSSSSAREHEQIEDKNSAHC